VGLKLNGAYQLMVWADDVILLGDNIDTMKKNVHTIIDDSKEIGLKYPQIKQSTCSCLVTRMQGKFVIYRDS
jgi:hypothetical protein